MAYWMFIRPTTLSARAMRRVYSRMVPRCRSDGAQVPFGHHEGRHHARAVARVDAGLLDVLHDAADDDGASLVRHGVDVELERVLQEPVDEHRTVVRHVHGARHVAIERLGIEHDGHAAAAEHVRRPHDHGEPNLFGHVARLLARHGRAAGGLRDAEIAEQIREALAVLGEVDRIRRRADDFDPGLLQREGQLQRRLAAELHHA
jgi:hypothetical protein